MSAKLVREKNKCAKRAANDAFVLAIEDFEEDELKKVNTLFMAPVYFLLLLFFYCLIWWHSNLIIKKKVYRI